MRKLALVLAFSVLDWGATLWGAYDIPNENGRFVLHTTEKGDTLLLNTARGDMWAMTTDPKTGRKVFVPCYIIEERKEQ